jgi:hypothetical protein
LKSRDVYRQSDGFVDRGASDLKSYFLQEYVGKTTLIKALVLVEMKKRISLGMV